MWPDAFWAWWGFEPFARSGLHQHRGVATSFFVDGGLTDHLGEAGSREVGINLAGSTHDAIEINERSAHANCFVLTAPTIAVRIGSRFGAMLLAWAEGPTDWADAALADAKEPFGF